MSATESDAKLRRLRAFVDSRTVEANEGTSYARGAANIAMQVLGEIDRLLAEPEPVKSEPELHKCCEEQRGVVVPEEVMEGMRDLEESLTKWAGICRPPHGSEWEREKNAVNAIVRDAEWLLAALAAARAEKP